MAGIPIKDDRSTGFLIRDLIENVQSLFRKELELAKSELTHEWAKGKDALWFRGVGLSAVFLGFIYLGIALAHWLASLGLDLWMSFGMLAVFFIAGGLIVREVGRRKTNDLKVLPRDTFDSVKDTVEGVKEEVQWITKRKQI